MGVISRPFGGLRVDSAEKSAQRSEA